MDKVRVLKTDLIEGQTDYYMNDSMHRIKNIIINGNEVEFEAIIRIKDIPKDNINGGITLGIRECEYCTLEPNKAIYVDDVKNPHCSNCGRNILNG